MADGSPTGVSLDKNSDINTLAEDPLTALLQNFHKCSGKFEYLEKMQARECTTRVTSRPASQRVLIYNEEPATTANVALAGRDLPVVESITPAAQSGGTGKRNRQEMASENAFSSEGSNKTSSGENPKSNTIRKIDTESFASIIGTQKPSAFTDQGLLNGTAEQTSSPASQGIIEKAQFDWKTHIGAMEQVLMMNRSQGLPTGPISEEALDLLSQMVSKLYELNGTVMYARMQDVMESHQRNTERIQSVFHGLAGVKKARAFQRSSSTR